MRPGVRCLERQPLAEDVAKVHLKRVVVRNRRILLHEDSGVAAIRQEVNVRGPVVDEHVLDIAVPGGIATFESGQFWRLHGAYPDGNLVRLPAARQMASQTTYVAYAQGVIPRKLVLDAQAELLHAAPFLAPSSLEQSHRTVLGYVEVRNSQPRMLCDHLPSLDASVSACRADSDG